MPSTLGVWLKRARESRQIDLDEAEKHLRIRKRYLQALENGDYDALPGPVQARGFLRNYARFLGLPVEEALARYEADLSGQPMQPQMRAPQSQQAPDRPTLFAPPPTMEEESEEKPTLMPTLLLILLGIAVFFALIAAGGLLYLHFANAQPTATPALSTSTPTVAALVTEEAGPAPTFVPAVDGLVHIRVEPQEHAWIRVTADDIVIYQGIAAPGTPIETAAKRLCTVETGNGGAFHIYVNDADWGQLGPEGKVTRRSWTPAGETTAGDQP